MGFIKTLIVFITLGTLVGGLVLFFWVKSLPVPDFETFEERKIIQSTKIYDRTGDVLLYDVYQNIKRTVIPYEDIPRHIKNATVAIEDERFYQHKGLSVSGFIRAVLTNLMTDQSPGGSTITQQLVKNTFLTPEKTITRKIKELILALKLEKIFSKEEILTLYLNEIPYGGSNYGVEAAALSYFGKNAENLTLAESAYLAALPQAPTYYSPYGAHVDELENRKNLVLSQMFKLGFVENEEFEKAKSEKVTFVSPAEKGIRAPHFVMFIKAYLEEKYGKDIVEQGGLRVVTTLDIELQEEAEKMTEEYVKEIEEKFNAKNAGLVGVDPKTGQILVMVGSRNYFSEDYEGKYNVTTAKRQPGSAFKPFVYSTAFKKGYTPETTIFDLKTEFNSSCNPDGTPKPGTKPDECYQPNNYDNIFRGPVTFREALAQSINVPAVKVLYLAGLNDSLQTAKDLGISTLTDSSRYGLTLVLGGGEVSLLEMTGAYSVFANNGTKNPTTGILKVEDGNGRTIEEFRRRSEQMLEKKIAQTINSILSDNDARSPAFGEQSWLYFPEREVAVKTGTTNDYRDAWVVGYTPNFALGLWVGNNDNSEMEKRVAGFIAAPLWNSFFKKVFEKLPEEKFSKEEVIQADSSLKPVLRGYWQGGEVYYIDNISGKLATEFTPIETKEEKIITQVHSILYWINKNNPNSDIPKNPEQDSQFFLWEKTVRDWTKNQKINEQTKEDVPKEYDDVHKPEYAPEIEILSPKTSASFTKNDTINIKIKDNSRFKINRVDLFLGETYLSSLTPPPYETNLTIQNLPINAGRGNLTFIVYDKVGNKKEYQIPINFD